MNKKTASALSREAEATLSVLLQKDMLFYTERAEEIIASESRYLDFMMDLWAIAMVTQSDDTSEPGNMANHCLQILHVVAAAKALKQMKK